MMVTTMMVFRCPFDESTITVSSGRMVCSECGYSCADWSTPPDGVRGCERCEDLYQRSVFELRGKYGRRQEGHQGVDFLTRVAQLQTLVAEFHELMSPD